MPQAKVTHKQKLAFIYRTLSQVFLVSLADADMYSSG